MFICETSVEVSKIKGILNPVMQGLPAKGEDLGFSSWTMFSADYVSGDGVFFLSKKLYNM